ncbi:MAG: BamA/TamA family outer membrane protein [Bradymonadaceae bacterium]
MTLTTGAAWAQSGAEIVLEESLPECRCYRVDAILIEGLLRTRRQVVERELLFVEGDIATIEEVEESVQRLRNTGLFRVVEYELVDRRVQAYDEGVQSPLELNESRVLRVTVDERWTIMPNFRFSRGGDSFQFIVGLQDANLLGSYLQLGGQYARLGDANSFALWFRNPRFLNERLILSLDVSYGNRTFTLYDREGLREGGFTRNRRFVGMSLEREWLRWLRSGLHLSLMGDEYSYAFISEPMQELQESSSGLPDPSNALNFALSSRIGRVDYDSYRMSGTQLNLRLTQSLDLGGLVAQYTQAEAYLFRYWTLPLKSTFGVRLGLGTTSSRETHHLFYAGGLDAVRGTYDMRFRGPYFSLVNTELRVPSLDTAWVVVQHVFFADTVGVSPYPNELFQISAASAGVGLRIISPKIYGFIMRFDYAFSIHNAEGPGLSYGAGQFF